MAGLLVGFVLMWVAVIICAFVEAIIRGLWFCYIPMGIVIVPLVLLGLWGLIEIIIPRRDNKLGGDK